MKDAYVLKTQNTISQDQTFGNFYLHGLSSAPKMHKITGKWLARLLTLDTLNCRENVDPKKRTVKSVNRFTDPFTHLYNHLRIPLSIPCLGDDIQTHRKQATLLNNLGFIHTSLGSQS